MARKLSLAQNNLAIEVLDSMRIKGIRYILFADYRGTGNGSVPRYRYKLLQIAPKRSYDVSDVIGFILGYRRTKGADGSYTFSTTDKPEDIFTAITEVFNITPELEQFYEVVGANTTISTHIPRYVHDRQWMDF